MSLIGAPLTNNKYKEPFSYMYYGPDGTQIITDEGSEKYNQSDPNRVFIEKDIQPTESAYSQDNPSLIKSQAQSSYNPMYLYLLIFLIVIILIIYLVKKYKLI
jgi:hypothetical protein